jgi:L-threonylcarbamoyladenylate synthase
MAVRHLDVRRERTEDVVEETARAIFSGSAIIYPDETGYVIACDPHRSDAVARIYRAAGSNAHLRVAMCVASSAEFLEFAQSNPLATVAVKRLLPAPVMLVIRRPAFFSDSQTAGRLTIGVRVPQDPLAHAILERCGPLLTCAVDEEAQDAALVLRRGEAQVCVEVSVIDLTGQRARLLRRGAVPHERLVAGLGPVESQTL